MMLWAACGTLERRNIDVFIGEAGYNFFFLRIDTIQIELNTSKVKSPLISVEEFRIGNTSFPSHLTQWNVNVFNFWLVLLTLH